MRLFKSLLRRKVDIEIWKLRMQLSDIKREKESTRQMDTLKQVDLILREKTIERDIELYRKLLV